MSTATVEGRPAGPEPATVDIDSPGHRRRWVILAVLCLSLLIVGIDGTIVNVALPSMVRELGASSSQLQWIVDAYTLVFASFLLLAGSTGDRHGRKGALTAGLVIFGGGSLASALAGSPSVLIATRAIQGFGGAFIMPSTLSILTNVFPADERGRAIGIWAGVSGLGVAIGPISGGYLLNHFWWGSIFLVNVPVILLALVAGWLLVPDSRDPDAPPLDFLGAVLSVLGLLAFLYGIIEGPTKGWTSPLIVGAFVAGAVLLVGFSLWEMHVEHPLLDVSFFGNPRFSAASIAVTLVFFAMFGSLFFLSQYLQFVLRYDALSAGVRLLPVAAALMVAAPLSSKLVALAGTKAVVAVGLLLVAGAMVIMSRVSVTSGYGLVAIVLVVIGVGMAIAMAPATDSIMGSLPPEKAGVGSAVNDTTREVGGALGVAVLGSITSSVYRARVTDTPLFKAVHNVSPRGAAAIKDSVGSAAQVAARLKGTKYEPVIGKLYAVTDKAFVQGLDGTVVVGAAVAVAGALVALVFLPSRPEPVEGTEELGGLIRQTASNLPGVAKPKRDVTGATLSLLTEAGFSSLTYHGVATRAGISTATLKRYWTSKVGLVSSAIEQAMAEYPVPDTGSFRRDCAEYLMRQAAGLARPHAASVIAGLIGAAADDPQTAEALRNRLIRPRRSAVQAMIERGITRGELDAGVDSDVLADLLVGPLYYRAILTGEPIDARVARQLVELALSGIATPTGSQGAQR